MATKIVTKNSSTASAVPTASDLVQGELAVNVADKRLFTEDNAGAIVELGTNPSTLTVTGEITANGGIALGDNDKATFGAGDDLQIYHDGSNSYIVDAGAGDLYFRSAANLYIGNAAGTQSYITAADGGAVDLRYNGSSKLTTTATGIDVTGTATMDGLTVEGNPLIQGAQPYITLTDSVWTTGATLRSGVNTLGTAIGDYFLINAPSGKGVSISTNNSNNLATFAAGGDISFYEDTGTTPKFFWDASAESLGIGTSSPDNKLHVYKGASGHSWSFDGGDAFIVENNDSVSINLATPSANSANILFSDADARGQGRIAYAHSSDYMAFYTAGVGNERMRIDASGNLGIGTDSPTHRLDVYGASGAVARITAPNAYNAESGLEFSVGRAKISGVLNGSGGTPGTSLRFYTMPNGGSVTERMRLDSSGNVGINTSSPATGLHLSGANNVSSSLTLTNTAPNPDNTWTFVPQYNSLDLAVLNNGTERMRIDSSGNLLVGVSAASAKLEVGKAANGSESDADFNITTGGYTGHHWLDANAYYIGQNSAIRSLRIYSYAETAGVNLAAGGTSWGTFSDERLKYDVEPIENALESLSNLRTVKYRLEDVDAPDSQKKLGLIAQDLVGVLDEVIDPLKRTGDETEYMSVRYTEMVPVLVKAIQEQQTLIESLTTRIAALEE